MLLELRILLHSGTCRTSARKSLLQVHQRAIFTLRDNPPDIELILWVSNEPFGGLKNSLAVLRRPRIEYVAYGNVRVSG